MAYMILRDDSLNVSAAFGTRAEALAAIRQAVESEGRKAVRGVALAYSPRGKGLRIIAEDEDLANLALAAGEPRALSPRS
jgi:hypothetical protein